MMKKALFLFTVALTLCVLCSCGETIEDSGKKPGTTYVSMSIQDRTLTKEGVTLILKNDSEDEYTYGEAYEVQKKEDGTWVEIPTVIENYGFQSIGYILGGKQEKEVPINWKWLYGELEAGEYRIVKDALYIREAGDYDTYHLSATFTIQ